MRALLDSRARIADVGARAVTSVFKNARIGRTTRYGDGGPGPAGTVMSVEFELEGQEFAALNGGPSFKFDQGISLFVNCDDQQEIDELWAKLSAGGQEGPCGWLTDRFGVSWQIVPRVLGEMLNDSDHARAQRVIDAFLQMSKFDIRTLEQAYAKT